MVTFLNIIGGIISGLFGIVALYGLITGNLLLVLYALIGGILYSIFYFAMAYAIKLLEQNNNYLHYIYGKIRHQDQPITEKMQGYKFDSRE